MYKNSTVPSGSDLVRIPMSKSRRNSRSSRPSQVASYATAACGQACGELSGTGTATRRRQLEGRGRDLAQAARAFGAWGQPRATSLFPGGGAGGVSSCAARAGRIQLPPCGVCRFSESVPSVYSIDYSTNAKTKRREPGQTSSAATYGSGSPTLGLYTSLVRSAQPPRESYRFMTPVEI